MARIDSRIAEALYAKINVSQVTNLATGGVFADSADGQLPYVVINLASPGIPTKTFGNNVIAEESLWNVRSYADENSSATKSPQALNDEILTAVEDAVGSSLTLSVGQTWHVERDTDIVLPIEEASSDKPVYGKATRFRVWATP